MSKYGLSSSSINFTVPEAAKGFINSNLEPSNNTSSPVTTVLLFTKLYSKFPPMYAVRFCLNSGERINTIFASSSTPIFIFRFNVAGLEGLISFCRLIR